jgi:hypothetical protein
LKKVGRSVQKMGFFSVVVELNYCNNSKKKEEKRRKRKGKERKREENLGRKSINRYDESSVGGYVP